MNKPLNQWTYTAVTANPAEAVRAMWDAHDEIERLRAALRYYAENSEVGGGIAEEALAQT